MSAVLRPTFYVALFCTVFTIFNFFSVRPSFLYPCKPLVSVVVSRLNYELVKHRSKICLCTGSSIMGGKIL